MGHVLMENRNGPVVSATVTQATGTAKREAAVALIAGLKPRGRITLGADKAYDVCDFVKDCRTRTVTPPIARNKQRKEDGNLRRSSAIDGRPHPPPRLCEHPCAIVEVFGWIKAVA